ncbi:hypothetical protein PVK06_042453 [Gossypium arboreum]|uniref:Uncharacterized protein n=1 Tax=Gossypium arboreum TaxID=29729 RepID=A0ABR0MKS9_GOSAR|nr:hypothetical protein PVK06_042453 [Gossypium arboreum]
MLTGPSLGESNNLGKHSFRSHVGKDLVERPISHETTEVIEEGIVGEGNTEMLKEEPIGGGIKGLASVASDGPSMQVDDDYIVGIEEGSFVGANDKFSIKDDKDIYFMKVRVVVEEASPGGTMPRVHQNNGGVGYYTYSRYVTQSSTRL